MRHNNTQVLAEIALFATIAFVLDILTQPLSIGPWISLSFKMVPIFILTFRRGIKAGSLAGFLWGLLQVVTGQAASGFLNLTQGFLEYFVAFALIGTAGLVKPLIDNSYQQSKKVQTLAYTLIGILIGSLSRYIIHFIAGMIFWGSYAPKGTSVFAYSLTVNSASFLGETIVCILTIWLLQPLMHTFLIKSSN